MYYLDPVNPDFERLQSTQASRLQEIRFIEEEKRRIQTKIQALSLVKQQQDNTVIQDKISFVVSKRLDCPTPKKNFRVRRPKGNFRANLVELRIQKGRFLVVAQCYS